MDFNDKNEYGREPQPTGWNPPVSETPTAPQETTPPPAAPQESAPAPQPTGNPPVSEAPAAPPTWNPPVSEAPAAPPAWHPPVNEAPAPEPQPAQTQAPFAPDGQSYTTYQQWQTQEAHKAKKTQKQPRTAGKRRKAWKVVGTIAAAVLIFVGGIALGGQSGQNAGNIAGTPDLNTAHNPDLPALSINSAPEGQVSTNSTDSLSGEEIYAKLNDSIVAIQVTSLQSGSGASGSGVIMSADGYIITNAHVVTDENTGEGMDRVTIQLADGTQLPAKIIGTDEQSDLAVIKVEPTTTLVPAEFGDSDSLLVGQDAYAIGSPGGMQLANSMTSGIISAINRDITINDRVMSLIQTNVTINPGNSGGALINQYGQVVGITSAKLGISYYEGLGFAIPVNSAKEIIDQLIQRGYVAGRPSIGITGQNLDEQIAQYNDVPQGVLVASVDSRAHAYQEGLQPKDIITAVDGQTITTMDEINTVKGDKKAGETIGVTVYRMSVGKSIDLTITLTDTHDLEGTDPATQSNTDTTPSDNGSGYGSGGQYYNDPFSYFFGY